MQQQKDCRNCWKKVPHINSLLLMSAQEFAFSECSLAQSDLHSPAVSIGETFPHIREWEGLTKQVGWWWTDIIAWCILGGAGWLKKRDQSYLVSPDTWLSLLIFPNFHFIPFQALGSQNHVLAMLLGCCYPSEGIYEVTYKSHIAVSWGRQLPWVWGLTGPCLTVCHVSCCWWRKTSLSWKLPGEGHSKMSPSIS